MNALHYFIELRTRLLRCLVFLISAFALLSFKANTLYTWLSFPLLHHLPSGHLIATQVVAPFFAPFKLAFLVAVLVCVPVFLYQTEITTGRVAAWRCCWQPMERAPARQRSC